MARVLRGPEREDHVLNMGVARGFYGLDQVRTIPRRPSHAGERKPLTLGHPEFEGFEVIQTIETTHPPA